MPIEPSRDLLDEAPRGRGVAGVGCVTTLLLAVTEHNLRRVVLHVRAPDTRGMFSRRYLTSVSILNIGRYIAMMITPTIRPTAIIMIGSMIEVSDWIDASTSSS